jgi:hypothetical protein
MLTHVPCEINWEYMWSIASLIMCQHVIKMHVMLKKTFELHYSYSLVNIYYTINVNSVHLIMVFKKLVYDKHNIWFCQLGAPFKNNYYRSQFEVQ